MRKITFIVSVVALLVSVNLGLAVNKAEASNIRTSTVVKQVNKQREKNNLQPLKLNSTLSKIAQIKADDMAKRNYFSHVDPEGNRIYRLFPTYKYYYYTAGDNLAVNYKTTSKMVKAWMNSESHRNNILNPRFRETGIGIAKVKRDGKYSIYVVQLFAQPY